ncbi:MAG: type II secretion system F family protein [Candidatus Omnitrophota bacterium]|jgi:type II secretory pathway component PulF
MVDNKRVSSADIHIFTKKLTTLIRARVELLSGLKIIYEQTDNQRMRDIVQGLYNSVKEGKVFSEALSAYPEHFSPLFINIIKAGETSGRLDLSFEQISGFMGRDAVLSNKVKTALAYPAILLIVGVVSVFILMNYVLPSLKPVFSNLGAKLPLLTTLILGSSDFSRKWWPAVVVTSAAGVLLLLRIKGSRFFRDLAAKMKRHIPLLKRMTANQELAHFAGGLSLLLKSGVPALKSLDIATLSVEDRNLKEGLKKAGRDIASGQSIAKCLQDHTQLPVFFTRMVAVGEESGRLSEVLDEVSSSYTQEVESDISLVSSLLEPVLILGMGVVLGVIVLSVLLPIFQITEFVH